MPHKTATAAPTVVSAIRAVAANAPERTAFVFLGDGENETASYTFAALDAALRRIGGWLQRNGMSGERVLLTIEPGELYVTAFLACLYAGAVAVPCYPPRPHAASRELSTIAADCGASAVLVSPLTAPLVEDLNDRIRIPVLNLADAISFPTDSWDEPRSTADDVALLQYTSGSTGAPKGVTVRHVNIVNHVTAIANRVQIGPDTTAVSWLPPYHDMGLIAFVLAPAVIGYRCVILSPLDFVAKPVRWLEAISRYGGHVSASPNFGYELCADRVTDEAMSDLDLSRWRWAGNGAEPVRAATMIRFADRFSPVGFGPRVFSPCYGLAEATLAVTLARAGTDPHRLASDTPDTSDPASAPVGCGEPLDDHRVAIVDPATMLRCPDGTAGEVWVSGPSVPDGYWNKPEQSSVTFHASLSGEPHRYLRTGDMGLVDRGALYVVGRYRDVIVVRGRNYAPADIEHHAAGVDARARVGSTAAFAVERKGSQQIVVLQEVRDLCRRDEAQRLVEQIRQRILAELGVRVDQVVLVPARSLPKTTSGKIQRRAARARYLAGSLPPAVEGGGGNFSHGHRPARSAGSPAARVQSMESLLLEQLKPLLAADAEACSTSSFADQGMDSVHAAVYLDNLSVLLGRDLRLPLLYEFPTVRELARHLSTPAT